MPLVSFEGIDGCGKSTQIEMLREHLNEKKIAFSIFREPGGTQIGEKIRSIVLDNSNFEMDYKTEFLLYAASRAQLVKEKIEPKLEKGELVILDRFVDSSVAYQGFGRGLGKRIITVINEFATGTLYPDLTFYLEIDEKTFRERSVSKDDRLESEGWNFMNKVIEGYKDISFSKRIVTINAKQNPKDIFKNIIKELENHFAF